MLGIEGKQMTSNCNCDPTTQAIVTEYLPELLGQYGLTLENLNDDALEYLESLLTSGELTQAREYCEDLAYYRREFGPSQL